MKKILISLLTLMLIMSMAVSVQAATTGTISLAGSNTNINAGNEFTIIVSASENSSYYLNTVEYSGITIKDASGSNSTAITVKSIESVGSNWFKMEEGNSTYYLNSGGKINSQEVFKITLKASDTIKAGKYNINVEGLKVYNTNLDDDTTNIGTKTVSVNVVDKVQEPDEDKTAPVGTITYDTNADGSVTAKITFNEENVTITNNDGKDTYLFKETGEFTFEFKDAAGNKGTAKAEATVQAKEEDKTPDKEEPKDDNTTANKGDKLPQTGIGSIVLIAVVAIGVSLVSYMFVKRYRDIK